MEIIRIWNNEASSNQLTHIIDVLQEGGIAVIPTDTMYAIVGNALNPKVIERICRLKRINPEKTNLSIICSDISMAAEYCRIDNSGFKLLKQYCPGPYTFLFKSSSSLPKAFKGRKIVGVRIPDCKIDLQIVSMLQNPLITSSIIYQDEDYAINPSLICENYEGKIDLMIEGEDGTTEVSTIIDCSGREPEIIREGMGKIQQS